MSVGELSVWELAGWGTVSRDHSENLKLHGVLDFLFYKQPVSGLSPEIGVYFQGLWGSKLLNGWLVF